MLFNELLQLHEAFSRAQLADKFVGYAKENSDQSPPHRKMIILEVVPLRLVYDVRISSGIHDDHVGVGLGVETRAIFFAHVVLLVLF